MSIVVGALLTDGRLAVLADRTISVTPGQWGDEVVRAHDEYDADDVVVEVNFGGDMATELIQAAADRAHRLGKRDSNLIRIKEVNASRGKVMRAEPISLMYEKGRIIHRRGLDPLEGEMMSFSREWDALSTARRTDLTPPSGPHPAQQDRDEHSDRLKQQAVEKAAGQ